VWSVKTQTSQTRQASYHRSQMTTKGATPVRTVINVLSVYCLSTVPRSWIQRRASLSGNRGTEDCIIVSQILHSLAGRRQCSIDRSATYKQHRQSISTYLGHTYILTGIQERRASLSGNRDTYCIISDKYFIAGRRQAIINNHTQW
jgi:hypothetical protein